MGGPWKDRAPPPRVPRLPSRVSRPEFPVADKLNEARIVFAAIVAALLVLALVCGGVL